MENIKLINTKKLRSSKYKYEFTFLVNGKTKVTKFGASGYSDYTVHKDIERRNRYINRHWKDLKTNDPTRPGYLSMYILWNFPNYEKSLIDYKKRLNIFNKTGIFKTEINGTASFGYFSTVARLIGPTAINFAKDLVKDVTKEATIITAEITKNQIDKQLNKQLNKIKKCKDDDKDCVEFGKIPEDVLNKKLYLKIKNKLNTKIKGRRWGVYDSVRLIKEYKELGGKYNKSKKMFGTDRWFKENWIDACAWTNGEIIQCGRSNTNNQLIKYCRPLNKVSYKTPKTVIEIGRKRILELCKEKMKNPIKRVFV
jgi:hypothetical protein